MGLCPQDWLDTGQLELPVSNPGRAELLERAFSLFRTHPLPLFLPPHPQTPAWWQLSVVTCPSYTPGPSVLSRCLPRAGTSILCPSFSDSL